MVDESLVPAAAETVNGEKTSEPELSHETDGVTIVPEQMLLKDLAILPPRQNSIHVPDEAILKLPPLRAEEPVQSLRAALAEVVGYAHVTNFRFELEEMKATNGSHDKVAMKKDLVISPYTGKDAMVMKPIHVKSLDPSTTGQIVTTSEPVVLDEYGDLTPLLSKGLQDGSGFRLVLERYDAATVKDHVIRVRSLLDGNPPSVTSLVEDNIVKGDAKDGADEDFDEQQQKKKPLPSLPTYSRASIKLDGNNLADFFYLACGEDPDQYNVGKNGKDDNKSKTKKKKKVKSSENSGSGDEKTEIVDKMVDADYVKEKIVRLNELDELTRVPYRIVLSGFHPPPPHRRLMGDIAYYTLVSDDSDCPPINVTATPLGFYVNKMKGSRDKRGFDPSPASESCYSHSLLDCLLKASEPLCSAWKTALQSVKEKAEILHELNTSHLVSLFPTAIRGDFDGFKTASTALQFSRYSLDASLITPSWLAPAPHRYTSDDEDWNCNNLHTYNSIRAEEELHNTFGVDVRNGALRDWNEELQLAREMPTDTLNERIERARLIHKVLTEFGEASLLGVKAIFEGQISPMNPNEPTRSQVYLHNNIFFSRAVDAGPETFKIAKGDKAAKKAANRDVQCIGTFHRMENSGLFTLATVLIDYIGTRFVCQSILPGILIGEKSHTLLYGSVETGVPLKWDEDFHKILEEKIGEGMMIATRPIYRMPLTPERMEEIKEQKSYTPASIETEKRIENAQNGVDPNSIISSCVPVEAKGILGSDQRRYVLDFGRLTCRDANWVPSEKGGTGKYESPRNGNGSKLTSSIPSSLDDDEWIMCVLRPELVTRFTQVTMTRFIQKRKEVTASISASDTEATAESSQPKTDTLQSSDPVTTDDSTELAKVETTEQEEDPEKLSADDISYLKNLKLNVNVFLPHVRSFEGIDEDAAIQIKADEQLARDAAIYLWDEVLPKLTRAVRDGSIHQLPLDGRTLTEFLHRHGVNCRYMGRLAYLAKEQEERDAKTESDLKKGQLTILERRTMPKFWLELIETEIVARAAKHVLDRYLVENGGVAATQPAQTIASFLSAIVSEAEETAAQTETRIEKRAPSQPDDEDFEALTLSDVGGTGDAVPEPIRGRNEVWTDIEEEVGRRFRYSLSLYNNGNKSGRALYIPLLRRVCQRSGIRIAAQNYEVGGKALCSAGNTFGGRLTASYPISPLDIVDVVPLMKHSAAYNEGFTPCTVGYSIGFPPLQISLHDARTTLERAHIQTAGRAFAKGLELAQEAASLYQRVTENAAHPGVIESMELMATIFLEAGDPFLAAANGEKVLGLTVQGTGFDSANTFNAHMSLFQMLFAAREIDRSVKHIRAAIYLLELMAGPRHLELFTAYHKLGSAYSHGDYEGKYLATAQEFFEETSRRESSDRLMEGIISKNFAKVLGGLENFKDALECEKSAFRTLLMFLGKEHHLTKDSENEIKILTKLAQEKGNKVENSSNLQAETAKAEAIAADLVAEEEMQAMKKKKKAKK